MDRKVTVIEPVKPVVYGQARDELYKKRVSAYVRVSTDKEDQKTSYDAQLDYYTKHINENPEWKFTHIYSDEGISGTSTRRRKSFNKMIEDAKDGKMDLILTKSISRFARNTIDCLSYIRKLRQYNVEIYFEKENLYSFDNKVDFMLTIMSSIAQEEARNTSENIKWSVRKRFREGIPMINLNRFFGYNYDENRKFVIELEGAEIVKKIFSLFLEGYPYQHIVRHLEENGIRTVYGNQKWYVGTIKSMLRNEKYKGDLLLQKTVGTDYLTHTRVINDNIEPKYYIKDNHEPIISREDFDLVQTIMNSKTKKYNKNRKNLITHNKYPFSGIVFCSQCGRTIRRRHWNKGMKSEKVVLTCGDVRVNKGTCDAKAIDNDALEKLTIYVLNQMIDYKQDILPVLIPSIKSNLEKDYLQLDIEKVKKEVERISNKIDALIELQISSGTTSNDIYTSKYENLKIQYDDKNTELLNLKDVNSKENNIRARLSVIKNHLNSRNHAITEIEPIMFKTLISKMIKISPQNIIYVIEDNEPLSKIEFEEQIKYISKKEPFLKGSCESNKYGVLYFKVVKL